jgi:hypothetical protein
LALVGFLAACDTPSEPEMADGPDFDPVIAMDPGGGGGGSMGAVITRGERTLGIVFQDVESGLTIFHGVDIEEFCSGVVDFDVVDFKHIETPSEAKGLIRQLKGEDLRASIWPWSEWSCSRVQRTDPLATGLAKLVYTNNGGLKSRTWGYRTHGTTDDGRTFSSSFQRNLLFDKNGGIKHNTVNVKIQLQGHEVALRNPDNGHYYRGISTPTDWHSAKALAESMKYRGCSGHLATITSQEESDFVAANLPWATSLAYWLGGIQPPGSAEPDGGWTWVTGETWDYTNWGGGEPNDLGGEDALHFQGDEKWNDVNAAAFWGYLVEFSCS